jgi:hypothetical protein
MPAHFSKTGDEVAIMPAGLSAVDVVLEIAVVDRVDRGIVYFVSGRSSERWAVAG